MRLNKLGRSELNVSQLGFGAMSLSDKDMASGITLIKEAYAQGINYFDTADLYGKGENEKLLGEALKGFREEIILATKVGNVWRADDSGWDWNVSKDHINKAIDDSLARLQTDYIDLYQLHGGTNADNYDEVIETFERLKDKGKIRAYGLSSIRPNVFQYYAKFSHIASNMMQFSALDTRPKEYFDFFADNGISVIARGALAQGILVEKAAKDYLTLDMNTVTQIKEQISALAKAYGVSNLAIALRYVLQNSIVASALVGIRTKTQLYELLNAYDEMNSLNANELIEFSSYSHYREHRD